MKEFSRLECPTCSQPTSKLVSHRCRKGYSGGCVEVWYVEKSAYVELLSAVKKLNEIANLGDFIYDVRERAVGDDPEYKGSSWDHPKVKEWSDAVVTIEKALKEGA